MLFTLADRERSARVAAVNSHGRARGQPSVHGRLAASSFELDSPVSVFGVHHRHALRGEHPWMHDGLRPDTSGRGASIFVLFCINFVVCEKLNE